MMTIRPVIRPQIYPPHPCDNYAKLPDDIYPGMCHEAAKVSVIVVECEQTM